MKKFLLGTTAVVAATAFGGAAFAQSASEPIKLGLGGYWVGAAADRLGGGGPANQEKHNQTFLEDNTVYVKGETKLDNGLGVGVMWQFRGEGANSATTDTVKRSYVRFFGGFGEIRFGDDDDSRLQKQTYAPQAGAVFGVNSPYLSFSNNPVGTNTTSRPIGVKRAQRIAYFSPTIAGFSFAASYAPNDSKGNISTGFAPSNNAGQNSSEWSVGSNYSNKFGDFRLAASLGATGSRMEGNGTAAAGFINQDRYAYDGGINVGFGPITVGGSYERTTNANQIGAGVSDQDNKTFDLGVLYTMGPASMSLGWSRGYYKGFAVANATSVLDIYEAVIDYVLGPGITISGEFQLDYYRSGVAAGAAVATQNEHDSVIAVGTHLSF